MKECIKSKKKSGAHRYIVLCFYACRLRLSVPEMARAVGGDGHLGTRGFRRGKITATHHLDQLSGTLHAALYSLM